MSKAGESLNPRQQEMLDKDATRFKRYRQQKKVEVKGMKDFCLKVKQEMIDMKEENAELKKENAKLRKFQTEHKHIVDYCSTEDVIVEKVEYCRFLRDTGDAKFAEEHPGLKQLVASGDKASKEAERELRNNKQTL